MCKVCGGILPYSRRFIKTCCDECAGKLRSLSSQGNPSGKKGGYREGSGRSKSGYYDGVFMGSTYELAYYIFQKEHGVDVQRNTRGFAYEIDGKKHTYLPDFIVDGVFIEIKGFYVKSVETKAAAVLEQGEKITILYLKELEPMMCYVDEKHGVWHRGATNNY